MRAKPASNHYALFARHVVSTLPDSYVARKTVLVCLLKSLPVGGDERAMVSEILLHLRLSEEAQLKLQLESKSDAR